jgi:hypothetical protein
METKPDYYNSILVFIPVNEVCATGLPLKRQRRIPREKGRFSRPVAGAATVDEISADFLEERK